ncbi:8-amino-7-oxononanoate synthase [Arsenicicoccus sp. oral taxon 190]|uniref:8-amino-7-oxononanoate synthase n=1 Tax=Arsenicicoccus sp. oral taxon 190 TaxID=1658671 RepID=UPI00067A3148|nr:8-amino-7-oxononanoate synthase [Arsenicicoccus sp. oral taxon 190]AKT50485.1 8-amino-7-oxononanoate synthase [Arsenicicoccus sp. oral taxon 190]
MPTPLLRHLAAQDDRRESLGLTRRLRARDGERLVDLAGNDYLGLLRHPRVRLGATDAVDTYGGGAGASRLVSGTLAIHDRLEQELAELTGAATGLALSTGYHANLAAVTALADADTTIVSDAHVHASLIDGCRLARARVVVARHHDVDDLVRLVREATTPRVLVVVESVYSVLGDAAPLAEIVGATSDLGATLLVDEAHGIGVRGDRGQGLVHELGLAGRGDVVVTATLSKSLAAQGGVVLAHEAIRHHLVNTARPFIYDTGLAPAAAGAALGALAALREEPWRPGRLATIMAALADAVDVPRPAGAVLSIPMPGPHEAVAAVAAAAEQGVRIGCFRPPSSPDGESRLRLTGHADLTDDQVAQAISVVRAVSGR